VPHLELALLDHLRHFRREFQQAQQIAHCGARTTDRIGGLLMRDTELRDQPLQCACFLERIQILALDVFDQRHRNRRIVRHLADDGGDAGQSRDLRSAPATFAGDDFIARCFACVGGKRSHHDWLDDALIADRDGELFQRFLAQVDARLVLAALQLRQRQLRQLFAAGRAGSARITRARSTQQIRKTPAQ
jgi:hypothetical protein